MEFKLHSDYKPTGDQPEAIKKVVENIKNGISDQILLGVTGSGKTFTIANIIKELNRPALIMAPNKILAAQLYNEYKQFFPENAVEYFVSYYDYYQPEAYIQSTDTYIEKDSAINEEIDKLTHAATAALLNRKDVIVIASVSAIYGLGSPNSYADRSLYVDIALSGIGRKELIKSLLSLRYERNDAILERAKFRVKGDVIDVYPIYQDIVYRFEFFDEELESISELHTLTYKKIRDIKRLNLMPATHYLSEVDTNVLVDNIREEMNERIKYFEDRLQLVEAQRIKQRTEYDIEMIREIGYCKGMENYSRYLTGKKSGEAPYTLLDYFPESPIVFLDESHIMVPQIGGMSNGDRSRKEMLVNHGFRLPSALDNRPLRHEEFFNKVEQVVYVSATPSDYEINESNGEIVELLVRPTGIVEPSIEIRPTKNQVDNLMDDIKERVSRGERILVTTLTKKMAEELTEYYLDYGIKVKYMHSEISTIDRVEIVKGLRNGEFDVLVGINLLREGLDLPEVSLVAILEADKEGFLRSRRSLIQTMGRAARNVNGHVILYADKITKSMKEAIDEVERRRDVQERYNMENNIVPQNVKAHLTESLLEYTDEVEDKKENKVTFKSIKELEKEIKKVEAEMKKFAENYQYEEAIDRRNKLNELKKVLLEVM
ncbi:excinuclease ABC subunit UvrB [Streptobacillus moniliformis]|uniref:UvrABC system protein B n=1 Tax=Streptobacillus moniliformis (strain ATCC 14647 / DSM 12112 / NCTC 10651 / 9901) TaxID=519441 RepID=D1AYL1_STRM9|nr:excinuclease ABC subunit UvrB [Streptobacillus moniliformis]ACZ01387.1 excinuclease ABC, B subunit [Streptobacillus moniliformis DSM 12112]AVL43600.1 excinuclease ABC subunit UvrB [Streptobacillus moniliformis]QXW66074.1 excinuclease ABC subunit UvrB [Streptobacillus moniliformis]SQA13453.1 Excinuclease ABC subunit B [Streptobacillus moniliformis]